MSNTESTGPMRVTSAGIDKLRARLGDDLPPLDAWTDEALVADFMCHLARAENADVIDMNADANALRAEILRRMKSGGRR